MNSSDEEWIPALAIGRAAHRARPLPPPPMQRQMGRGRGRGRAQLPQPPPGLAAIYCLPADEVALQRPLMFRGGFEVPSTPMVVRYGFPEAEIRRTRTPSPPPRLFQAGRGRGRGFPLQLPLLPQLAPLQPSVEAEDGRGRSTSESREEVGPDPPREWIQDGEQQNEGRLQQGRARPTREAGAARPGCWNCGEFGHSRINCPLPQQRTCYMCGRPGLTIATCPTCCQEWGQRRRAELQREPQ